MPTARASLGRAGRTGGPAKSATHVAHLWHCMSSPAEQAQIPCRRPSPRASRNLRASHQGRGASERTTVARRLRPGSNSRAGLAPPRVEATSASPSVEAGVLPPLSLESFSFDGYCYCHILDIHTERPSTRPKSTLFNSIFSRTRSPSHVTSGASELSQQAPISQLSPMLSPLTPPSFIAIADRGRAIPHTFNPGSLRSRLGPTPPAADRKQSRTPFSKDVRPTPCSRLGLSQHALLCTPMHSLSLQAAHWGTRQYRTVHTPDASWRCLHDWRHLELYRIVIALGRREELISSQSSTSSDPARRTAFRSSWSR